MNKKQKDTASSVAAIMAVMMIFPPVQGCSSGNYELILNLGSCEVNFTLLFVQWLVVIVVGTIYFFIQGDKENTDD